MRKVTYVRTIGLISWTRKFWGKRLRKYKGRK